MKPISELNISPWPWRAETFEQFYTSYVMTMQGKQLAKFMGKRFGKENAHLIAAAPEMYECLLEAVTCKCAACGGYDTFYCKGRECQVKKWRAVLDKVSGEKKVS